MHWMENNKSTQNNQIVYIKTNRCNEINKYLNEMKNNENLDRWWKINRGETKTHRTEQEKCLYNNDNRLIF